MTEPVVRNARAELIACDWVDGAPGRRERVVIGHGVTSDKRRPWSCALSAALAHEGVASVRLAFSGNGDSEGRFEDSTITKERADLGAVLDAIEAAGDRRVAYVGHSMGAAVGLLRAATDARIGALVSLAGMVHTAEFVQRMFGHLAPGEPMLDKPRCPFGHALKHDLEAIGSVVDQAPTVRVPWLLVHGSADDVVPVDQARALHAAACGRAELIELDGVDHSFSGPGLDAMLSAVVPWLVVQLGPSRPR